jgi:cell division protein FtsQ
MARSAQRGNRRRAWPRWARPALKAALTLTPLLAIGGYTVSAWQDGTIADAADSLHNAVIDASAGFGFALDDVLVEGRTETEPSAILEALGVHRGDPVFGIDLADARDRLLQLPWIANASVERRLPDILYVRVTERQPMAIWQHERRFTVIDRNGRPLADATELARRGNRRMETLPQVVGANAPQEVPRLLEMLDQFPLLRERVVAANWISDRRWDLKLDNGIIVKLPEGRAFTALRQLMELHANGRLFERDIVAIDMRQPDRMVVQTSDSAIVPGMEEDKKKKSGKRT